MSIHNKTFLTEADPLFTMSRIPANSNSLSTSITHVLGVNTYFGNLNIIIDETDPYFANLSLENCTSFANLYKISDSEVKSFFIDAINSEILLVIITSD